MDGSGPEARAEVLHCRATACLNEAAALIALGRYGAAEAAASDALNAGAHAPTALRRRARARAWRHDYAGAQADLDAAAEVDPDGAAACEAAKELARARKAGAAREAALARAALGGVGG